MCSSCLNNNVSFLGPDFQALFRTHIDGALLFIDSRHAGEAVFDAAFSKHVAAGDLRFLVVHGHPDEPLGPWRSLVGALSSEIGRLDRTAARVLHNLLDGKGSELPLLNSHHARYRTFDAMRQLLDQVSRGQPLVILVDRVDQSDAASLQFLSFLSPFLPGMRIFVAASVDAGDEFRLARVRDSFPHLSVTPMADSDRGPSAPSSFGFRQPPIDVHPGESAVNDGQVSAGEWLKASKWAGSVGASEFVASYLGKCLESATDPQMEWVVLLDLIKISAETGRADDVAKYMALWLENEKTKRSDSAELSGLIPTFSDLGLTRSQLAPLIERLGGNTEDVSWARIELLEPPQIASVASGRVTQGRWLGANQKATRIVREQGTEEDFAHTLYVYDWWSRQDLEAMLTASRNWKSLSGRSRALSVAAETLMYRYGEFARACALLEEQAEMHIRNGWLEEQAKSLVRLSMALLANGELDRADETRTRARDTVWRLGPDYLIYEHAGTKSGGDLYPEISMESNFAWYREGDWLAVAEHWAMAVAMHEGAGSPVHIVEAAMTSQAYARLGRFDDARQYLDELMSILPKLQPRDWAFNGAVGRATHAIWDMLDAKYAPAFLEFSEALISQGVGDWTNTSIELSAARMAALLGKHTAAAQYFSKSRERLNEHQAPQLAIVDFDEAIALRLAGNPEPERRRGLLASAMEIFVANRMTGWRDRAERESAEVGA